MDFSPLGSSVHGGSPGRIQGWVAMTSSRGSSQPRDQTQVSRIVGRFFTSWSTREAQEYWSGWPIPSPADLSNPGIELRSPALQADSLKTELSGKPKFLKANYWDLQKITSLHIHWWLASQQSNLIKTVSITLMVKNEDSKYKYQNSYPSSAIYYKLVLDRTP